MDNITKDEAKELIEVLDGLAKPIKKKRTPLFLLKDYPDIAAIDKELEAAIAAIGAEARRVADEANAKCNELSGRIATLHVATWERIHKLMGDKKLLPAGYDPGGDDGRCIVITKDGVVFLETPVATDAPSGTH